MSLLQAMTGFKPTVSKLYATPFVGEVLQYNNAGAQGALQNAFGTEGSLALTSTLSNPTAQAIQVLSDGTFIVALSVDTSSVLQKYNAEGTLQTASYGTSGVATLGVGTTAVARAMILDAQGRILVCGGSDSSGTAGWLKRVSTDGQSVENFATNNLWQFIGGIAQQATGKIIAVGFNGTNAQIGRYNADLTLDYSFGNEGFIIFDGTNSLSSRTGLYSVILDPSNYVYVTYLDGTNAKAVSFDYSGNIDQTYWKGILSIPYLNLATVNTMRVAFCNAGILIGAAVSGAVNFTCINYSNSDDPTTFADFSTSVFDSLYNVVPTTDGKVLLVGSDTLSPFNMAVMRLTAVGGLDNSTANNNLPFNTTGYNLFNVATPTVASVLYGASIAPNGQLYAVGYQSTGGTPTVTPYVSCLYNAPYVSAVAQFPVALEQGLFDTSFGTNATQSVRGVQMPYNGTFGASLQQQTRGIVELAASGFLVGSDGYTGSSANTTMMLTWLTASGALDTNFGSSTGKLTLPNDSTSNETMAALAVGGSDLIYVVGTNATPLPYIRSYESTGNAITSLNDTGIASVGIAIQGTAGILLFAQDSATTGHISRYTSTVGTLALDNSFGTSGNISTTALGLNMGPVYGGGLVNRARNIIIGYKNSSTGAINVAMISKNGDALIPEFGTAGIAVNVFGDTNLAASNVRVAFDTYQSENIYVAAVNAAGTAYLLTRLDAETGIVDQSFNDGAVLTITPEISVTALTLTNLTGLSDGTVMLTGYDAATDPVMLTMRVASVDNVATLDTTFNSQGAVPGVVPMQIENETANYIARVATSLAVQSYPAYNKGNLVYTAYEQQISTQSTPEVMRLLGEPGTTQTQRYPLQDQYPGTLDISLNDCGAIITDLVEGSANVVYTYPDGNTYEGMMLLGFDTGTNIVVSRVDVVTLAYDINFNPAGEIPGVVQINNLTGLENIMVDVNNNIIINGTNVLPAGWAQRIPANGDSDPIVFSMPSDITAAHMVYQQKSGRYIVAGSTNSVGTMVAFQDVVVAPATGFAVDLTFNPLSTGSSAAGRWNIAGSTSVYSLAINSDDTIYTAYKDTATNYLTITQVLANGSGFYTDFAGTGKVTTTITPDSAAVIRCVVNLSQNIIVAASCGSGTLLKAALYSSTGAAGFNFTTATGVGGSAGIALKALLETENQQTILIGSNTAGGHGQMFAARLSSAGVLDTTWNPNATSPDVPGMLTFGSTGNPLTDAITIMNNATISVAGNIFAVGGNGTNPVLMEIVGDSYVNGVAQGQLQAAAGIVDTTLTSSGSLNLVTAGLVPAGYTPNKLYIYPNGSMVIGASNGIATTLTKVNATLAFDTTFNHGAVLSVGSGTEMLTDMFVDDATGADGTIYLTGENSTAIWATTVSADGLTITNLATSTSIPTWTTGSAIRKAANDNIIVAGYDGDYGAVASFFPNGAALDPYFATNGVYQTSGSIIAAMTIDSLSRIYIAYATTGTNITIDRLTPAGIIDPLFTPVTWTGTAWSATAIKMVLDEQNNQLIIAAQDGSSVNNILKVARFSTIDGSATGTSSAVTMSSKTLALSDVFVDTNQDIYVVGTNSTNSKVVVARLLSSSATTIALDTANYAVTGGNPGIANVTAGSIRLAFDAGLDPDGRVYVVGSSLGTPTAYMARLFGDNYFTEVSQAVSGFTLGQLDYSYGTAGVTIPFAGGLTSNQFASTILPITTGSKILVTVADDSAGTWTVRLLSDGAADSTYGNGQGIAVGALPGYEFTRNMIFDGLSNAVICGSSVYNNDDDTSVAFIKNILPNGSMNQSFGGQNSDPAGTVYFPTIFTINTIAQLTNGNYVFGGADNSFVNGIIGMIDSNGRAVTTFGTNGFVTIGAVVSSISVDAQDNIFAAFGTFAHDQMNASVAKLNAAGQYVTSFGTNGIAANILTNLANLENIIFVEMVLDATGNIVVVGGPRYDNLINSAIYIVRLTAAGIIDPLFITANMTVPSTNPLQYFPTSLVALDNGKYLVSGLKQDDNDESEFVAAINNDGSFDTNFAAQGVTPGIGIYDVFPGAGYYGYAFNISVQSNGQILLAGYEQVDENSYSPITMRINGYVGSKSILQFPGLVQTIPTDVSSTFGISYTLPAIMNLMDGGSTAVDSLDRVLIGGITTDHTFVVARFLSDGTLDSDFSTGSYAGIAQTPVLATLRTGSFISVDSLDNVYIGGMTSDNKLMVAKFLGATGSLDTAGFNSSGNYAVIPGVTQSVTIPTLVSGGYMTVDYLFNPIVGGITSDHKLVVARFTELGLQDGGFGTSGVAQTGVISTLQYGGYVATEQTSLALEDLNNVYIGASTYDSTLIVACFDNAGILDNSFGILGIAVTDMITNLSAGGPVALDSNRNVLVGGFTNDKTFVAGKFLPNGSYDPAFSSPGITYSNALASLDSCVDIAIDSNDNILLGGTSTAYDSVSKSMVVARWTPSGTIDTTFTSTGIATTGTVDYLVSGGFIAINALNNVLTGGYAGTRLVIGALNSGAEIFISNPRGLPTAGASIYLYGNDRTRFRGYLGAEFFVTIITDIDTRNAVLAQINASLDEYLLLYANQPDLNLAASTTPGWDSHFSVLSLTLAQNYPDSAAQIVEFFVLFNQRRLNVHNALATLSRR